MNTFLDPAILFFIFGAFAGLIKSNLEIPKPITKFLSLYLLMGLGLKGGFALNKSGFNTEASVEGIILVKPSLIFKKYPLATIPQKIPPAK